jgi:hypothetical protein
MSLNDLHSDIYISTGQDICYTVKAGDKFKVPVFISSMSSKEYPDGLILEYEMQTINYIGALVSGCFFKLSL